MAWTATARKAENSSGSVGSLNVTLASTVAGNFIAVATSAWKSGGGPTAVAVSDGVNGSYSQAFLKTLNSQTVSLHYFPNNGGGSLTITVNPSGGGAGDTNDMWVAVHEFAGGNTASPLSGTPSTNSGSSTGGNTGAMTPADNDVLLIAGLGYDSLGTITENGNSEGFTLSNENELPSGAGQPGSFVYKIISGAPGSVSETWALSAGADWAAGIAAFKPAGAAPSGLPPRSLAALAAVQRAGFY